VQRDQADQLKQQRLYGWQVSGRQRPGTCRQGRNESEAQTQADVQRTRANMKNFFAILAVLALLASWPGGSSLLAAPREMSDAEMDAVTGGDAPPVDPSADQTTGSDSSPSVTSSYVNNSVSTIIIRDQAQQNLTSMVNILSINSSVQVMLNLNVSINSTVGSVGQGNVGVQTGK
jgi:hypothetical protein